MKVLMSDLDKALIISASIAVALGLVFFFLAGVHKVKKNYAVIIEKAGEYYKTFDEGWHFAFPIIYQRVGLYCIIPQVRRYTTLKGNRLSITYQIEDVKTFHYCHMQLEVIMRKIEEENSEIDFAVLESTFARYGLKFINIKRVEQ
ncbi:MAG: hypothetical protein K6F07_01730 [Bacilli bacterium]|nr:hypothetical protein [Bacilli bacterium]